LRFVDGGNGFAGQSSMRLHFGLGAATAIDKVEVRWPSGVKQTLTGVPVDMLTKIIEGSSQ
jgi:enediyne biosynthesis protein E4